MEEIWGVFRKLRFLKTPQTPCDKSIMRIAANFSRLENDTIGSGFQAG
jgi:hypothetical protein